MSTQKQLVTTRDLIEEAKKRIVILSICVVGLSYIMSLTSTSVWVNLPAAAILVILFRYFALDFEMRRKEAAYSSRTSGNVVIQEKPLDVPKAAVKNDNWKKKVNSPPVEEAIDQLTRHVVSEWVTDLWYSKLTPDRDGPEELVQLMNGVLGEIAYRLRNINLIDLVMRDAIHIICKHLEVFRICQAKVKKNLASLSFAQRDMELKSVMAAENKLHPLLFSAEVEHKVLQHIMDGLLSLTFKPEDLQCSFFRYVSRELLACAVMRPVLNLANPRFINERIEQVVMSSRKGNKEAATESKSSQPKQNGDTSDLSPFPDPSASGVELVELKNVKSNSSLDKLGGEKLGAKDASKDPLLSVDARSTRSWSSFPSGSAAASDDHIDRSTSGGEWGEMLDYFSRRKTQALAPEHFENLWSKGRNYNSKDTEAANQIHQNSSTKRVDAVNSSKVIPKQKESGLKIASVERGINHPGSNTRSQSETMYIHADNSTLTPPPLTSDEDDEEHRMMPFEETESVSSSQSSSGDEENRVTGLDSPTTKVWDGRTNRNSSVSHIRHPLEALDGKKGRRANKGQDKRLHRQKSGRKRSRLASQKGLLWEEVERTSFLSGIGQDIHPLKPNVKDDDSSDDYDTEIIGRLQSGTTASSSASSLPGSFTSTANAPQTAFLGDTFFKLRCEVLGANIVTSSSKTFAVYSISVSDAERNSWSIKRRYRHFEELHRRLKEYPEYNLHLPPKHFLSIGLDVPIIQERCKLLDQYLKKLMQLPTISGSIDVWDFLSIDSQTYTFSSAFSIIETFSVRHHENSASMSCLGGPKTDNLQPRRDQPSGLNHSSINSTGNKPVEDYGKILEASGGDYDSRTQNRTPVQNCGRKGDEILDDLQQKSESFLDVADDSTFPVEWVPPNLSGPVLDLVDVVFQLQEGAWIRRKAFWVAKQVLQLGMGDALDDWLVEKIQRLRRGSTIASGIKRVEQILWPDGIFITKHPSRQKPPASASPSLSAAHSQLPDQKSPPEAENVENITELQEKEAGRRAKFVYELMIDNAPSTVVGIVGRKEYEQCAKDLYYFLQSSVCLKQLVMDLLQLVLLYAFPELDHTFKQLHEEKQKFGEFKAT